jgi:hypothetical protein
MAVSSLAQVFLRCITRTAFLVLRDNVRLPNRRLMARNEDDFRIRPGKVRNRGGGQETNAYDCIMVRVL